MRAARETDAELKARLRLQAEDRAGLVNDPMELIYADDLDEVFAELVRLHGIVRDERTAELIRRVFTSRLNDDTSL